MNLGNLVYRAAVSAEGRPGLTLKTGKTIYKPFLLKAN